MDAIGACHAVAHNRCDSSPHLKGRLPGTRRDRALQRIEPDGHQTHAARGASADHQIGPLFATPIREINIDATEQGSGASAGTLGQRHAKAVRRALERHRT